MTKSRFLLIGLAICLCESQVALAQDASANEIEQLQRITQQAQQSNQQATQQSSAADKPNSITPRSLRERLQRLQRIRSQQGRTQAAQQGPISPTGGINTATNRAPATNMANTAEASKEKQPTTSEAINEAAFRSVLQDVFPLTPAQILRLRETHEKTQFAASQTAATPPKPTATSQIVNLAPGSTPPVIRLAQGFVSSLVFLDQSGADWPIVAYDLGNPKAFNIQWDKKSNTIMIQANELYTYGNLAVKLEGLSTPVMLTLIPGQKAVDYRVDLRIQGYGPNVKMLPRTNGLPPNVDSVLLSVLDGIPPPQSTELKIKGGPAQVWILGDKLYVRTRLSVISPGWLQTVSSADGMHVYEMQKTPMILVTMNGKVVQFKVEGL